MLGAQSTELTRGALGGSAISFIGGVHIGTACPKFNMVWIYGSPIPMERRGLISSFKLYLPSFPRLEEGGLGSAPCGWMGMEIVNEVTVNLLIC